MMTSCSITSENSNLEKSCSMSSMQRHQQDLNEKHQLNRRIANLENEIVQREQEASQKGSLGKTVFLMFFFFTLFTMT